MAVPIEIVTIERAETTEVSLRAITQETSNPYVEAILTDVPVTLDLASASPALLARFVENVVSIESPVHREEVIVRIRSAWNLMRSGGRIQAAIDAAIQVAIRGGGIAGGDFLYVPGKEIVPRDRSIVHSLGLRRAEMLPPVEIDAAILDVISDSMGGTSEQVIQAVSRMFGFKSTSGNLREVFESQMKQLLKSGDLIEQDGMLNLLKLP